MHLCMSLAHCLAGCPQRVPSVIHIMCQTTGAALCRDKQQPLLSVGGLAITELLKPRLSFLYLLAYKPQISSTFSELLLNLASTYVHHQSTFPGLKMECSLIQIPPSSLIGPWLPIWSCPALFFEEGGLCFLYHYTGAMAHSHGLIHLASCTQGTGTSH